MNSMSSREERPLKGQQAAPVWLSSHSTRFSSQRAALQAVEEFLLAGIPAQQLPEMDVRELHGEAGRTKLLRTVAQLPMGSLLLSNAFRQIPWRLLERSFHNSTRLYPLNNGFFPTARLRAIHESFTCVGRRLPPRALSYAVGHDFSRRLDLTSTFEAYWNGQNLTDMHVFVGVPNDPSNCAQGEFGENTTEGVVYRSVLDGEFSNLPPHLSRILRSGQRPIFSAMHKGTGVNFHHHANTWFALTHGRKAWWIGPPTVAHTLSELGNNDHALNPCEYLHLHERKPHAKLLFHVQEAGQIILFGDHVAHATCALENSIGVGSQMGFTEDTPPYLNGHQWSICHGAFPGYAPHALDAHGQCWNESHFGATFLNV